MLLTSVPGHVDAPHTSCTHKRCCTIDFLWYSSASLRVTSLGEIPSAEKLRSEEGPKGIILPSSRVILFSILTDQDGSQKKEK